MMDATTIAAAVKQASASIGAVWTLLLGLAGLAIGGGGGVALYKSKSERRRNDAEASNLLAEAAATLIKPLQDELHRLTALADQVPHLTARVATLEADARQQHRLLIEHSVWDHLALVELRRLDVDLPPIPPLFAASLASLAAQMLDDENTQAAVDDAQTA